MASSRIKVVVLGCYGVGKTCLVARLTHDHFRHQDYTYGANCDFLHFNTALAKLKLEIWDVMGIETFVRCHAAYTRGASMLILCYDVSLCSRRQSSPVPLSGFCISS